MKSPVPGWHGGALGGGAGAWGGMGTGGSGSVDPMPAAGGSGGVTPVAAPSSVEPATAVNSGLRLQAANQRQHATANTPRPGTDLFAIPCMTGQCAANAPGAPPQCVG